MSDLQRIYSNIAECVLAFCRTRVGGTFHMWELVEHVGRYEPSSPDSPSRILRELRLRGRVHYELVSRADSLYRVISVEQVAA
jgi:hypothetical protein